MSKTKVKSVEPCLATSVTKNVASNFSSNLKPFKRWMGLIGISTGSCCHYCIGFLSFSLTLLLNVWLVVHVCLYATSVSKSYVYGITTTALSWNFIIDGINCAVYVIGSHAFSLFLTRSKTWKKLTNCFEILERNLASDDIYPRWRQLVISTIIYMVASGVILNSLLIFELIWNNTKLTRKILDGSTFFLKIIPLTVLSLFCILVRLIAFHLNSIRVRIEHQLTAINYPSNVEVLETQRQQLKIWKGQHLLASKAVVELNNCFGVFLTIEVSFVFIGILNSSMFLLMSATNRDWLLGMLCVTICLDQLIQLFFLTSSSENITNEVHLIYETLTELVHFQPSLQNEAQTFLEQVLHMRCQIIPLGLFTVNNRLFPTLIGTTLTYFFILLQFHTAQKENDYGNNLCD